MSLEVNYNNEIRVVESLFSDSISIEELFSETEQCIALAKEHSATRFLCDASNAIINISIFKVLELEKIHVAEKLSRHVKIAVIEPIKYESKKFTNFYELAFVNRGWNVRVFQDQQLALNWLLDSPSLED